MNKAHAGWQWQRFAAKLDDFIDVRLFLSSAAIAMDKFGAENKRKMP
jgi:hypothetical protein